MAEQKRIFCKFVRTKYAFRFDEEAAFILKIIPGQYCGLLSKGETKKFELKLYYYKL